jgi:hypothetical protein
VDFIDFYQKRQKAGLSKEYIAAELNGSVFCSFYQKSIHKFVNYYLKISLAPPQVYMPFVKSY